MITDVWAKSSRSGSQGNCVEVRRGENGDIQVRDSKHPHGPVLTLTPTEWHAFITATKACEFSM